MYLKVGLPLAIGPTVVCHLALGTPQQRVVRVFLDVVAGVWVGCFLETQCFHNSYISFLKTRDVMVRVVLRNTFPMTKIILVVVSKGAKKERQTKLINKIKLITL